MERASTTPWSINILGSSLSTRSLLGSHCLCDLSSYGITSTTTSTSYRHHVHCRTLSPRIPQEP
eukprot:6476899-Amphidinium_carterae.3